MHIVERVRALRPWQSATIVAGVTIVGLAAGGVAIGAAGASPSMQVLPSPIGVKYGQTVEVKAQNLPKGSGTIAVTICGLNNAAGQPIASPGANDCGGENDLGSGLVKLQPWKDGTFDQQYTLPASGKKFGTNQRFCDATHYCAVVVADANPSAPAYFITTELQFTDQKPLAGPTTTTKAQPPAATSPTTTAGSAPATTTPATTPATAPAPTSPPTTETTTLPPGVSVTGGGSAGFGPGGGQGSGGVTVVVTPPSGGGSSTPVPPLPTPPLTLPSLPSGPTPNPVPPQVGDAVTQACAQLAQVIQQSGQDTSLLTTACSTLVNGGGGAQLQALLQSPSVGCFELSSVTQGNAQLADACSQLATALQPYSSQLGTVLAPVLGLLP